MVRSGLLPLLIEEGLDRGFSILRSAVLDQPIIAKAEELTQPQ